MSRHQHRLSFVSSLTPEQWNCGVCWKEIDTNYGRYSCVKDCNYAVHSKCATRGDIWDGKELEGISEDTHEEVVLPPFNVINDGIIQHFIHQNHHMKIYEETCRAFYENKCCQACALPICDESIYNCVQCDFILHKACAHLPRKKQHALHPHPLSLKADHRKGLFVCKACECVSNGFIYECSERGCDFRLDVRCASISEPLDYHSHSHPLFLTLVPRAENSCWICPHYHAYHLNCSECDFVICFYCATLPKKLRYELEEHFLIFSYGDDVARGRYLCDACEVEVDSRNGIYMCNDCDVMLHIQCLLGKEMYMLPGGKIEVRNQIVTILPNNRQTRNICRNCHDRCQNTIVYILKDGATLCSMKCAYFFLRS